MSVKIQEEKQMLRKHYADMRKKMTEEYKRLLDTEAASRFLISDEYIFAKQILIYAANPYEVETRGIIRAALLAGKKVALPVCEGEGIMSFYYINSLEELTKGKYSIDEPPCEAERKVTDFSGAVCLVPGLSFDPDGNRLGYGKGYYDRFLRDFNGKTVGVCYASFVKWNIPSDKYDVPVQYLLTDGYLRRIKQN